METGHVDMSGFVKSFDPAINSRSVINGYDYKKAIATLDKNAKPKSIKLCAKYVRMALEGGGLSTVGRPNSAKDYDTFLPKLGFKEISESPYAPLTGDLIVIQSFGTHIHGHIQMYNGENWVSDFVQKNFWPGSDYKNAKPTFQIFR
jgi:hypothetical protein